MKNKIFALVPARGGSKRIKNKNMVVVGGKPLIQYTLDIVKKCKFLDEAFVSTEDEKIKEIAKRNGVKIIDRPKELAKDETPMHPVIKHAIEYWKNINHEPDIVVLLQPTSPLRTVKDIDDCVKKVVEGADSSETFIETKETPFWMFWIKDNKAIPFDKEKLEKYQRIEDLPKSYKENGAVYVFRIKNFIATNSIYGDDHRAVIMPKERSLDIDDSEDLEELKRIIEE
jgi:CMP-N-acetylneuraminic acid synthetase